MALRALMLRKKIDAKRKELDAVRARLTELQARETELEASINEAADLPDDDETKSEAQEAVEAAVADHEKDVAEANATAEKLESEISDLENDLADQETETETPDDADEDAAKPANEEREVKTTMEYRDLRTMPIMEREAFLNREDVQHYLGEVRAAISEKRAITNVGLTIPEVFLGMIRQNIENYSKLYKHVNVRRLSGTGRLVIMGGIPEAIWTECCANLNELSLTFNDMEVDCFKVGGYFAICNASLEDSDLNLVSEIMIAIGQSIGLALDKAILYGRNTSANQKMPLGVVSRLAQTAEPSGYPATARAWVDLHTTNILSIAAGTTGKDLFAALVVDFGVVKGKYSRGTKVWVMNEKTYTSLIAASMSIDAGGAIVAGVNGSMPVVGGVIETLDFVPDNVIIAGYFDLYLLAERAGNQFASSEHVRFLNDQTVMKGTARYDGAPIIAEAFVAIGLNGVTPDADMTFAADTANQGG